MMNSCPALNSNCTFTTSKTVYLNYIANSNLFHLWLIKEFIACIMHCYFNIFLLGDKLQTKMYKNFKSIFPCVLLTNATHSIGCTCEY